MKTKKPVRLFRTIPWGNISTGKIQYGLQSRMNISGEKWANCMTNGELALFETPDEARAEIRQIRKRMRIKPAPPGGEEE